jgi:hypothetical protein
MVMLLAIDMTFVATKRTTADPASGAKILRLSPRTDGWTLAALAGRRGQTAISEARSPIASQTRLSSIGHEALAPSRTNMRQDH